MVLGLNVDMAPDRRRDTVLVAETFVSTQGEGPLCGQRCAFVRLSRCNLRCGWCDTKQTWDWSRYNPSQVSQRVATGQIVDWVATTGADLLVITGGEPMLQQPAMTAIAAAVSARVQVETNGTIAPTPELADRVDMWVVSPKLTNSAMPHATRIVPGALAALAATGRAVFKFVVSDVEADFAEIAELQAHHGLTPIWVMPEGDTAERVVTGLAAIHDKAVARGWNVSGRLHVLAGAR
ncbi:7-carboxy-7-deazaguanine synthase QueE [Nocardia abscessus]|uniref:7-carboxy-7-deazaguanine synthase QueE n=1 Tax=Nocardia abscessus TaxID=120957 RepID=UPI002454B6D7|nr:7-carboxy-7-deazaguanine synthase QueE [Nocardia abscessus]